MLGGVVSLGKYEWMLFACRLSVPPFTPPPPLQHSPLSPLHRAQRKSLWIDYNFIYDYSFYLLLYADTGAEAGAARECCNPAATISMALNLFWAEHKVTFPRQFHYGSQLNWYWHYAYCANNAQCHAPRHIPHSPLAGNPLPLSLSAAKLIIGHQPNWPTWSFAPQSGGAADASSDDGISSSVSAWRRSLCLCPKLR